MLRKLLFSLLLITSFIFIIPSQLYAQDKKVDLTVRWGQGGFTDNRSPLGKLGGGQVSLDVKLKEFPIALSLSGEYYKNSRFATHSYEIENMTVLNILYVSQFFDFNNTEYFFGGGIGEVQVPKDLDYPESGDFTIEYNYATVYNLEAGINVKYFNNVGFYGVVKYLQAEKTINNTKVIDFNEKILLLGLTFNFSIF